MSGRRIYVDCFSQYYRTALVEDGKLTEFILNDKEDKASVGDIFVGRVEKILPSKIAFINIGEKKPVFLQLNDKAEEPKAQSIKCGKEIAIAIIKESFDEKCAVATTKISVAGKFCAVVSENEPNGVSAKITDTPLREKLLALADEHTLNEENVSIVMRTACQNADIDDIEQDLKNTVAKLKDIMNKAVYTKAPALIYKELNPVEKTIRDMSGDDCEIFVNDKLEYHKLKSHYDNVTYYNRQVPLFIEYGIESSIEKLFHKKIWLKCGGYIVIDETEAMTVIDVNSGKNAESANIARINKEAAIEAARQIRLRNLNGMIIIDFINMDRESNESLYNTLKAELKKDRVRTVIVGMTELGLMQITRQKQRKPLSRYIYHTCPNCDGLGRVKVVSCIADSINDKIISLALTTNCNKIKVSANDAIITALKDGVEKIQSNCNVEIELNCINTSRFDYYEIEKSRN